MLFTASEATGKNFPVAVYNLWQWLGQVILTLNVIIDYRLFSLCCCRLHKSLSFTPRSRERVETENKILRQWVNFYCNCHWQNSNFLSPCPCKGKNSFERYKTVLSSRSFIKQRENKLPWKDENGLSRNQKLPWSGGRVGFSEWWKFSSCVLCCWQVDWCFRLYSLHPCAQVLTHEHPCKAHRGWAKTAVLGYYKHSVMSPGLLWVTF